VVELQVPVLFMSSQEASVINREKIEEWIREVEERPSSAALILQYIATRLEELTRRNDELRSENIALVTEKRVSEYKTRIAALEYQVALLKRQLGSETNDLPPAPALDILAEGPPAPIPTEEMLNLLVYNPTGRVLRFEFQPRILKAGETFASLAMENKSGAATGMLIAGAREELLFAFDSGRSCTLPLSGVPASLPNSTDWSQAFLQAPKSNEELAALLPVGRMALSEYCIQASRKGFVRRIREEHFEQFISKNYIGSGTLQRLDRMCALTLGSARDRFVMISREGFLFSMPIESLPVAAEAVIQLSMSDHIVAAFIQRQQSALLFITQTGKAVHRESGWLETATSFRSHGQPAYTKAHRDAGVHVTGATAVDEDDWTIVLFSDGRMVFYPVRHLFDRGAILEKDSHLQVLSFCAFRYPRPA
jgi:DNA gyrase/topoisomerase IV subunit A